MIYPSLISVTATTAAVLATALLYKHHSSPNGFPPPPGPKQLPIIGNLLDMPTKEGWKRFSEWAQTYGKVVYIRILGLHMVVLNTYEAANDLLDKRSLIYSDRPRFPVGDLVEMPDFNFGFMQYGKEWQIRRSTFANHYGRSVPSTVEPGRVAALHLIQRLRSSPDQWHDHLRLHLAQLSLDVTYGLEISSRDHPVVRAAEDAMDTVSNVILQPGMWIVNPVHILKNWPVVLGGTYVRQKVKKWHQQFVALREVPWAEALKSTKSSFVTEISEELAGESEERRQTIVKECAAIAYGGAVETTFSYMTVFILTMILNPEAQRKAQEELDRVIGGARLPRTTDRPNLPYVQALLKEVLRWHSVTPLGVPHLVREDDIYNGYFIPKGSMIVANLWHILRDPNVWPNADRFEPERFLKDGALHVGGIDPSRVAFGFGRRICPGQAFAQDSLFMVFTHILSVYRIESGEDIDPASLCNFSSGAASYVLPFKCHFTPRSPEAEALLDL